jgi:hypothetical protein
MVDVLRPTSVRLVHFNQVLANVRFLGTYSKVIKNLGKKLDSFTSLVQLSTHVFLVGLLLNHGHGRHESVLRVAN